MTRFCTCQLIQDQDTVITAVHLTSHAGQTQKHRCHTERKYVFKNFTANKYVINIICPVVVN